MALELYKNFSYKCPGSVMIMGEHAVLHGKPAIVAAINKYLEVKLEIISGSSKNSTKNSSQVTIQAQLDDAINYTQKLHKIISVKPLEYILAVITYFKNDLSNFDCDYKFSIQSEINHKMGLGSSAAVTIATICVILKFLGRDLNKYKILDIGKQILVKVQGIGSGADLAASLFGGVLWYEMQPAKVEHLAAMLPIIAIYSGYKLSTAHVIAKINQDMKDSKHNINYQLIFELIGNLVLSARDSILNQDWLGLGQLFNMHYGLQEALALSDQNLSHLIYQLKTNPRIAGAKISGSGLGDCIIGVSIGNIDFDNIKESLKKDKNYLVLDDVTIGSSER